MLCAPAARPAAIPKEVTLAVFSYQGLDTNRSIVRGTVSADTPRQARDVLRAQGLAIQRLDEQKASRARRGWFSRFRSGASQWPMAVHELAMLLHAGIPLLEALDTIARQHTGRFQTALLRVRDRVSAGSSLAEALGERPDLFDAASIHLVEVGENSGSLEAVLEQLADFKQRLSQTKDQVFTALMYPAFLLLFGTAASIYLMTSVMPPLLENLEDTVETLPWPTRIVRFFSNVLMDYGIWLVLLMAVLMFVVGAFVRSDRGRRLVDRCLLKLPLIGQMALKQGLSRIAMIISTLSRSGVVLTNAFELAANSTNNTVLRDALHQSRTSIDAGDEIADALERTGVFPPLAVRVFSVGQESGKLEDMLARLATDYDRQVATTSARLTTLLEPVMILILSVFVGFIMLATILPILEAGNVF